MSAEPTYNKAMNGTNFEVTRAMFFMPPTMTSAVNTASRVPNTQPLSANQLASPPVTLTNCTYA